MSFNLLLPEDATWFPGVRTSLHNEWQAKTKIRSPDGEWDTLACNLHHAVPKQGGHLSIACSLNDETDQLVKVLQSTCYDDDPVLFFRVFLFLIDEFSARLEECYPLLGHVPATKQPELISVWTNRYAKHRTAILIQHHALHVFLDDPRGQRVVPVLLQQPHVMVIDTDWLKAHQKPEPLDAKAPRHAVVIIPPLSEFLNLTIGYYRAFWQFACSVPKALDQFQSPHHRQVAGLTDQLLQKAGLK